MSWKQAVGGLEAERERVRAAYAERADRGPWFGHEDEAHFLRLADRRRVARGLLHRAGLGAVERLRILDIGCGAADELVAFLSWGARPGQLAGLDLRPGAIDSARARLPGADLRVGCASEPPWPEESFDLVLATTFFSSVLDRQMRARAASATGRLVRPGGAFLVYDSLRGNPRNPAVAPISVAELAKLFPEFRASGRRLTFLPHVARRLPARLLRIAYPLLTAVPALTSHRLTLLVRRS